jgi:hypothetical protein
MITPQACLFNAVALGTATVNGDWFPVYGGRGVYSFQATVAGTPSAGTITLQGSNDGVHGAALTTFVVGTDTNYDLKYVVDKPVSFLRASAGPVTGGASPTCSAWFTAAE